ncbi:MAG: hypothetical protein KF727_04705 [Microbacteriaceae bacterium]|nr:hypothetical protein [Microbacteriaceae bacterium]
MSIARRLRRIPVLVWIVAPVVLAALIAWPLGGWDTVELRSRVLPEYAANQVLHTHRFDVRVGEAWLTMDHHPAGYDAPDPLPGDPAEIYLVVRAEFTNTTAEPARASDLGGYLVPEIDGVNLSTGFVPIDYVLAADGTTLPELNPGLERELLLVWTIPRGSIEPGDELRIALFDGVPQKSTLGYGLLWILEPAGYAIRTVGER